MSRSKVKVTRDKKNALCTSITPAAMKWNALAANNVMQQQTATQVVLEKRPLNGCRLSVS